MNSMDTVRERCAASEQPTEPWTPQTHALDVPTCPGERRRRWRPLAWPGAAVATLGLALAGPHVSQAKTFSCDAGDVPCLIHAITTANANGEQNTIRLQAGTYTLTDVDNDTDGPNGLPSIRSPLTLTGEGADATVLERAASAPPFRLVHVAASGHLRLTKITLRGGGAPILSAIGTIFLHGAGLYNNGGTVHLVQTTVAGNVSDGNGIGLYNNGGTVHLVQTTIIQNRGRFIAAVGGGLFTNGGTVRITHSRFTNNGIAVGGGLHATGGVVLITQSAVTGNVADLGGGIGIGAGVEGAGPGDPARPPVVTVVDSTVEDNRAVGPGGGIVNFGGLLLITNSTVAHNRVSGTSPDPPLGGGLANFGTTVILNATLAENSTPFGGGGLWGGGGTVTLQNTLLASNRQGVGDCIGVVTSLGHNLIGDPTFCPITLQPSDLTGDPGLGEFTETDRPGTGHFPLLPTSQAIDAGNDTVCPLRDQLGQRRVNIPKVGASRCDIGAIEFPGQHDRHQDEEDAHHDKDNRPHDKEDDRHDKDRASASQ